MDRLLRGAIWDFFEAYHISFIDPPETSWAFQTIDFLIRTTMSVFVFVGLAWGFVLWKYRRQYKKEMRILYTKYLFIDALRRQVHDWAQTIPQQVGDERDVRSRFDRVVLPRLWSDEGPQTDLDFHEYKAAYEQRKAEIQAKGEPLSDLLDVDVPLMEDWKLSDKQKDAIAAARGPIDPP